MSAFIAATRTHVVTTVARRLRLPRCKYSLSACAAQPAARGALIVFEGIDRCGKSTQSKLLVEQLREKGVKVEHWHFPDRTTNIGQAINDYLQNGVDKEDTVIHLLFTANRFEKRKEMLRLLAAGTTLVVDRYAYSGVAYTAAKGLPHLDAGYCRAVEVGLPAADLVLLMELDPALAAARGGFGRERYEKLDMQHKVAQQYASLQDERWLALDAASPPEVVHQQVMAAVLPVVERAAGGAPLGRLWDYSPLELPTKGEANGAAAGTATAAPGTAAAPLGVGAPAAASS